ncbi:MAG: type IV secretory system conjugative DNA transfer family protein [Erysipelotrichaceae bacterium]|nr:type IV secretory system conjugative DNA transfer family protein [Erysipelotrichaceae bacterium]
MRRIRDMIIALMISLPLVYAIGIQFINVWVYHNLSITFNFSLLAYKGGLYFIVLTLMAMLPPLAILFNDISYSKNKRSKNYSLLQSSSQIKKNLVVVRFNKNGPYLSFLDEMRIQITLYKSKIENSLNQFYLDHKNLYFLHLQDFRFKHKMKRYKINDHDVYYRGGLPIVTSSGKIWCDPTDSHSLIVGTTNSGKTYSIILILIQLIRMSNESCVVVDVKGELSRMTAQDFINDGYTTYFIDFINPQKSDCWNPLSLAWQQWQKETKRIEIEKAKIEKLMNEKDEELKIYYGENYDKSILYNQLGTNKNGDPVVNPHTGEILLYPDYSKAAEYVIDVCNSICQDPNAKDPMWNNMAGRVMRGIVFLLLEEGNEKYINFESVKMVLDLGDLQVNPKSQSTYLKEFVYKYRKPTDLSYQALSEYLETSENTKKSIKSVFGERIDPVILSQQIKNMTSSNDIDFSSFGNQKTVIFLKVHDEKSTYYPLVNLFMRQFCEVQTEMARNNPGERLKVPIDIVWDEFGNSPTYEGIKNLLSAGRSRGIRVTMVIQGYDQLDEKYGDKGAKTIKSNCMNTVYLLSGDNATLKEISDRCGSKIVYVNGKEEKEPIFTTDRLQHFQLGEALFLRQRENPYFTKLLPYDKYRIYDKNSNYTGEDKPHPNAQGFDIKKEYLNRMVQERSKNFQLNQLINAQVETQKQ